VHGDTVLGGPIWFVAQFVVFAAIGLSLMMLLDPLRPTRRAQAREGLTDPLWVYQALGGVFLVFLLAVQVVPGVQLGAAVVAIAAPLVVVAGMVYLLRVVFPKRPAEDEG